MTEWLEFSVPGRRFKIPADGLPEELVQPMLFWFGQVTRQSFNVGWDQGIAHENLLNITIRGLQNLKLPEEKLSACNCACTPSENP